MNRAIFITFLFTFYFARSRRHTRCLSDWSSDMCSSALVPVPHPLALAVQEAAVEQQAQYRQGERVRYRNDRDQACQGTVQRSEERRVGQERRYRGSRKHREKAFTCSDWWSRNSCRCCNK